MIPKILNTLAIKDDPLTLTKLKNAHKQGMATVHPNWERPDFTGDMELTKLLGYERV